MSEHSVNSKQSKSNWIIVLELEARTDPRTQYRSFKYITMYVLKQPGLRIELFEYTLNQEVLGKNIIIIELVLTALHTSG